MLLKYCQRGYPLSGFLKRMVERFSLGSYEDRLRIQAVQRPHYGHCLYHGALLAKKLGLRRVSAIEFGVAGGNGLLSLESHARSIEKILDMDIEIYGFDTGEGLPPPVDYRDLPYHWQAGFFKMDREALLARLTRAKVIFGDIHTTVDDFCERSKPAPVCAMFHDFDYYSSTKAAFRIFQAEEKYLLPRVYCYFDDTVGGDTELFSDYVGQRLAIHEFNQENAMKKLAVPYNLRIRYQQATWAHQVWIYHDFSHFQYNSFIGEQNQQLAI